MLSTLFLPTPLIVFNNPGLFSITSKTSSLKAATSFLAKCIPMPLIKP